MCYKSKYSCELQDMSAMYSPFHQLGSSEIGRHGLVMLTLHCKWMAVGDPCWTIGPLQSGGFAMSDQKHWVRVSEPKRIPVMWPETNDFFWGCQYKPKVSSSMFIFMANHEIVAPNSKPGNLIKSFIGLSNPGNYVNRIKWKSEKNTYWVVGIQVYKFVWEVKQLCKRKKNT